MAIEFVGGNSSTDGGAVSLTALTGGTRSSVQEGDLVLVMHAWGSTTNGTPAISTSGYTNIGSDLYQNDTRDINAIAAYKFMGATPDASVIGNTSGNTASHGHVTMVRVYSGVNPVAALDVTSQALVGANTGRPDPASLTPTTAGTFVVIFGAGTGDAATLTTALTAPASFTAAQTLNQTAATIRCAGLGAHMAWSSGAVDPLQFGGGSSSNADSWAAYTIALRAQPAAKELSAGITLGVPALTATAMGPAAAMSTISDGFEGSGTGAPPGWSFNYGTNVTATRNNDSRIVVSTAGTASHVYEAGLASTNVGEIVGSSAVFSFDSISFPTLDANTTGAILDFYIYEDGTNVLYGFDFLSPTSLRCYHYAPGTGIVSSTTITYTSAIKNFRIREAGGSVYMETSDTDLVWTTQHTATGPAAGGLWAADIYMSMDRFEAALTPEMSYTLAGFNQTHLSQFVEAFDVASTNTLPGWVDINSSTDSATPVYSVANGRANIESSTGVFAFRLYRTRHSTKLAFAGSHAAFDVYSVYAPATSGDSRAGCGVIDPTTNQIYVASVNEGTLALIHGTLSTYFTANIGTYNATTMRYLRVRNAGTSVYVDGADADGPWVQLYELTGQTIAAGMVYSPFIMGQVEVLVGSTVNTSRIVLEAVGIAPADAPAGGITEGTGNSAGVATPTGIAAALRTSTASSAGVAAASGVSAARVTAAGDSAASASAAGAAAVVLAATGTCAGVASASGQGVRFDAGTGSAAGSATVAGVSTAHIGVVGTGAGAANVAGQASSTATNAGTSTGLANVTGAAAYRVSSTGATSAGAAATGNSGNVAGAQGSAAAVAASSAESSRILAAVGTCAGVAAVTGASNTRAAVVGTSAGAGTATGQAAVRATATGTSAGAAVSTGTTAGVRVGAGTSAGTATVAGAAAVRSTSTGTSTGAATLAGVAAARAAGTGTGAGNANVAGQASSTATNAGTSTGLANVTGAAAYRVSATGTAAGSSTATGQTGDTAMLAADGTSAGTATPAGAGAAILARQASSAGAGEALGVAAAVRPAASAVAGVGAASASAAAVHVATGTSTSVPVVSGASGRVVAATGTADAGASVTGAGAARAAAAGTAAGTAAAAGESAQGGVSEAVGAAAGTAAVTGAGAARAAAVGTATGAAVVDGYAGGSSQVPADGASAGTGTATGAGARIVSAVGTAAGSSTTSGDAFALQVVESTGTTVGAPLADGRAASVFGGDGEAWAEAAVIADAAYLVAVAGASSGAGAATGDTNAMPETTPHAFFIFFDH